VDPKAMHKEKVKELKAIKNFIRKKFIEEIEIFSKKRPSD
jgi:hypothetical protein